MAKLTVSKIEQAIHDKRGNIAAVARSLGVARKTIYNRVEASPTLKTALEEARDTMLDNAERALYDEALNGNITALIFFLKTQGKRRGYTERQELTGADGGPVIVVKWDDGTTD